MKVVRPDSIKPVLHLAQPIQAWQGENWCGICSLRETAAPDGSRGAVSGSRHLHSHPFSLGAQCTTGAARSHASRSPALGNLLVGARCSESCTPGARASGAGNRGALARRSKPLPFSPSIKVARLRASWDHRQVCDQDTASGRQCPDDLVAVKGGASPLLGVRESRATSAGDDGGSCRVTPCVGLTGEVPGGVGGADGDGGRALEPEAQTGSANV
jgi:hypothetical protein